MTKPILLIHGGAGVIRRDNMTPKRLADYHQALNAIANAGKASLLAGKSALDVVAEVVCLLEDNPLFNAGTGSVLTHAGTVEMDAAMMDGRNKSAGAVTCVSRLKNPILAAKAVLQCSPHVCLAGQGAEQFAHEQGIDWVENETLICTERRQQLQHVREQGVIKLDHDAADEAKPLIEDRDKYGTVGAVALDCQGNLAAATSTGGLTNKAVGRVGDTPIIGAGCYADALCAVSTTGTGEAFMRGVVAHDVSARMRYAGQTLAVAAEQAIHHTLSSVDGQGGLIALDKAGNIALPMNTQGMYRAIAKANEAVVSLVFCDD